MEKKKIEVKNFTTFKSFDDGGKVRIVKNDAGEEIGFELSGTLTKFDYRNENDMTFKSGSYDRFVDDYFISHSLNVPVCLQHNDCDIRNVCGKVKEMTKTDSGVDVVVYVPKSAYYYNLIKNYVNEGILQGFSNAGYATVAEWSSEDGEIISEFALLHVALVTTPADVNGIFRKNTLFKGFSQEKEDEDLKLKLLV